MNPEQFGARDWRCVYGDRGVESTEMKGSPENGRKKVGSCAGLGNCC